MGKPKGMGKSKSKPSQGGNTPMIVAAIVAVVAVAFFMQDPDQTALKSEPPARESAKAAPNAIVAKFKPENPTKYYLMYEVGPGERFNMRRDLIIR
jgi:hypothetical protein